MITADAIGTTPDDLGKHSTRLPIVRVTAAPSVRRQIGLGTLSGLDEHLITNVPDSIIERAGKGNRS